MFFFLQASYFDLQYSVCDTVKFNVNMSDGCKGNNGQTVNEDTYEGLHEANNDASTYIRVILPRDPPPPPDPAREHTIIG